MFFFFFCKDFAIQLERRMAHVMLYILRNVMCMQIRVFSEKKSCVAIIGVIEPH